VLLHGATPPVVAGGTPETTAWSVAATSKVTLIGEERSLAAQTVDVAAAVAPADWRTIDSIAFPRIDFALGGFIDLDVDPSVPASGSFDPATGEITLDLPLTLTDELGQSATLTVAMTSETTNGLDDGAPVCIGAGDPTVCEGAPWNPGTGQFQLVGILTVPEGSDIGVDGRALYVEIDGTIAPSDSDADGLLSFVDNCPSDANIVQADADADALGDACDDCNDVDHDDFGAPGHASCPRGATTDCDDTDDGVFPGGPEFCDGIDNDCSTTADDATCGDFDVNADTFVDGVELSWLGRAFGQCSSAVEWWSAIDVYEDGCVDGDDLALLAVAWDCAPGPICP
jgi:hypothetical protein